MKEIIYDKRRFWWKWDEEQTKQYRQWEGLQLLIIEVYKRINDGVSFLQLGDIVVADWVLNETLQWLVYNIDCPKK